jgi:hypothetical protein
MRFERKMAPRDYQDEKVINKFKEHFYKFINLLIY